MAFTREQEQAAYKKLPPEMQEFIMSNEVSEAVAEALKNAGLTDEQSVEADSEVLYAMLGLQKLDAAIVNIAKLSGKDAASLATLKQELDNTVTRRFDESGLTQEEFVEANLGSKLEIPPEIMAKQIKMPEEPIAPTPVESVPALPEIAPENLPMIEPGETAHVVPHVETAATAPAPVAQPAPAPAFTPVSAPKSIVEEKLSQATVAVNEPPKSSYAGKDPYREPIE